MDDDYARVKAGALTRTLFDPAAVVAGSKQPKKVVREREREREKEQQRDSAGFSKRGGHNYNSNISGSNSNSNNNNIKARDRDRDRDRARTEKTLSLLQHPQQQQPIRIEQRAPTAPPAIAVTAAAAATITTPTAIFKPLKQRPKPGGETPGGEKEPATRAAATKPGERETFKLIADAGARGLSASAALADALSDFPGCFIVGVVGRKGVGKSSVLNLFGAGGFNSKPPFTTAAATRGIDLHTTRDGLVLLDMQPIAFAKSNNTNPKRAQSHSQPTLDDYKLSEKLTLFMFSVCHVILVVSSGSTLRDDEMWAFLRKVEAIKYRADGGKGPVHDLSLHDNAEYSPSGKRRRNRRARRKPLIVSTTATTMATASAKDSDGSDDEDGNENNADDDDDEVTVENLAIDKDSESNDDLRSQDEYKPILRNRNAGGLMPGNSGGAPSIHNSSNKVQTSINKSIPRQTQEQQQPLPSDPDIFFPSLIFVHNRAKPSDFAANNYASSQTVLTRAFRNSRLKISSPEILNLGTAFPHRYKPPTSTITASTATNTTKYNGYDDWPNLWILPSFPTIPSIMKDLPYSQLAPSVTSETAEAAASNNSASLLDRITDPTNLRALFRDSDGLPARYAVLCEMLRDAVFEIPRYPIELPPPVGTVYRSNERGSSNVTGVVASRKWFQVSEREWYKSAIGIWNALE
ncbi:hypothetical protein HK100_012206 [Physocladia obscura]|uniref:G domain-containing protein n=1 Tax=Physocladia obscura TaxID=109957 RepID=A0AAD5TAV2_9FUNG|nr:hypothetical protein HK100_012206 [Physocladia obscura]